MTTGAASAATSPLAVSAEDLNYARWWIPVLVGVVGIIVGILALAWPGPTLLAVGLLFGIYLLFAGFGDLFAAFNGQSSSSAFVRVLFGILGVVTIGAGFILLIRPAASVLVAAFVLGFWFLMAGSVQLVTGFAVREHRAWNLIFGVIGIVAGIAIVAQPGIGVITLVYIVSFTLIMRGVVSLTLGFAMRSAEKSSTPGAAA
ncbi:MAG: DUF308 domain-containing protein [Solirubrobacteraceae bacterium]|nr:DUF308 domain-containing protein [Solirubrobacteraceae bacterium]